MVVEIHPSLEGPERHVCAARFGSVPDSNGFLIQKGASDLLFLLNVEYEFARLPGMNRRGAPHRLRRVTPNYGKRFQ